MTRRAVARCSRSHGLRTPSALADTGMSTCSTSLCTSGINVPTVNHICSSAWCLTSAYFGLFQQPKRCHIGRRFALQLGWKSGTDEFSLASGNFTLPGSKTVKQTTVDDTFLFGSGEPHQRDPDHCFEPDQCYLELCYGPHHCTLNCATYHITAAFPQRVSRSSATFYRSIHCL